MFLSIISAHKKWCVSSNLPSVIQFIVIVLLVGPEAILIILLISWSKKNIMFPHQCEGIIICIQVKVFGLFQLEVKKNEDKFNKADAWLQTRNIIYFIFKTLSSARIDNYLKQQKFAISVVLKFLCTFLKKLNLYPKQKYLCEWPIRGVCAYTPASPHHLQSQTTFWKEIIMYQRTTFKNLKRTNI